MRLAIFGGSFDPVHLGHLWIAESSLEALALDRVLWIPAATSPLKPDGPLASSQARLDMVRLAIAGSPQHVVDDREITRGDISYTVDTLASIRAEHPDAEIFLLIGSDSLATLPRWKNPAQILELADLAVIQRAGEPPVDWSVLTEITSLPNPDRRHQSVRIATIELSSSELRDRVQTGRSIRFRTPHAVEAYIRAHQLYRSDALMSRH